MRISTSCRLATAAATLGSGIAVLAQNDGPFLTTGAFSGIDAVTGARPARKNINSLCRDGGPEWYVVSPLPWMRPLACAKGPLETVTDRPGPNKVNES